MGGGESKEEQAQNEALAKAIVSHTKNKGNSPRQQVKFNPTNLQDSKHISNRGSHHPSPRLNNTQEQPSRSHIANTLKQSRFIQDNNHEASQIRNAKPNSLANIYLPANLSNEGQEMLSNQMERQQQIEYFSQWPAQFQNDSQLQLEVTATEITSLPEFKQLHRKTSKHRGVLRWAYEKITHDNRKQLCLRIVFQQEGGFILRFLVDQGSDVIEGDQELWNLLCPFRTSQQVAKVGNLLCERTYQGSQEQNSEVNQIDPQSYAKWQEKRREDRLKMKEIIQKRRNYQNLERNISIDYKQMSKYFTDKNDWVFSVRIEQKSNSFKSWLIMPVKKSSKNSSSLNQIVSTVQNDIQNRESMYVEEMKKKRDNYKRLRKRKGTIQSQRRPL